MSRWQTDFRVSAVRISCFSVAGSARASLSSSNNSHSQGSLFLPRQRETDSQTASKVRAPLLVSRPAGTLSSSGDSTRQTTDRTRHHSLLPAPTTLPLRNPTTDPRHHQDLNNPLRRPKATKHRPTPLTLGPAAIPLRNHESRVVSPLLAQWRCSCGVAVSSTTEI